ncbi:hypothetical protein ACFFSY_06160 [Paenibacillus aurantiacus]|uniref:Uncharacterized protein n=1 Tax=Paenibacillus aurantiacus TaxID=1936118 RepID=A0ABV5KMP1_9BACL
MATQIQANFPAGGATREAELKLQALRAREVTSGEEGVLRATVDDEQVDRVLHVIAELGGTPQLS